MTLRRERRLFQGGRWPNWHEDVALRTWSRRSRKLLFRGWNAPREVAPAPCSPRQRPRRAPRVARALQADIAFYSFPEPYRRWLRKGEGFVVRSLPTALLLAFA